MAMLNGQITFTAVLRPCYVDGKKALFHRWVKKDKEIINYNIYMPPETKKRILEEYEKLPVAPTGCDVIISTKTVAIIEYEDGSVEEVEPIRVKFADDKTKEYAF